MVVKNSAEKIKQRIINYKTVFGSDQGQRVLYDMMKRFGMLHSSFIKNDPYETAFMEGQRNVMLYILTQLKIDPTGLDNLINQGDSYDGDNG